MCVSDRLAVGIELASLCGRAEYDVGTFCTYLINEYFQLVLVVIPRAIAWALFFLIVMAELYEYIIALL